jgi:hypothetical protein
MHDHIYYYRTNIRAIGVASHLLIDALVEISRGNRITPHGIEGPGSSLN